MSESTSTTTWLTDKNIEVLMSMFEIKTLGNIVGALKPEVAVEIGSWAGGSAWVMAPHVEKLFCVDSWVPYVDEAGFGETKYILYGDDLGPDDKFNEFCKNLEGYLFKKVFPCRGSSMTWAKAWYTPIDFLFIDGCHSYEAVKADSEAWTPHVKSGGVILGHDYRTKSSGVEGFDWEFPGVAKAVQEYFKDFYLIPDTTFWMVIKQ